MEKVIFLLLLILIGLNDNVIAQDNPQSNQTIIRLTIIKDNDKILMRKTKFGWMTPAIYYKERQTISEVLDSISGVYGNYKSGQLKPKVGEEEIYWMPIKEALNKLESTVPSLMQMTKQILDYPNTLWGGSFILFREKNKINSRMEEEFYPLFKI